MSKNNELDLQPSTVTAFKKRVGRLAGLRSVSKYVIPTDDGEKVLEAVVSRKGLLRRPRSWSMTLTDRQPIVDPSTEKETFPYTRLICYKPLVSSAGETLAMRSGTAERYAEGSSTLVYDSEKPELRKARVQEILSGASTPTEWDVRVNLRTMQQANRNNRISPFSKTTRNERRTGGTGK